MVRQLHTNQESLHAMPNLHHERVATGKVFSGEINRYSPSGSLINESEWMPEDLLQTKYTMPTVEEKELNHLVPVKW